MTDIALGNTPTFSARVRNTGASNEARRLEIQITEALNTYRAQAPRQRAEGDLAKVVAECSEPKWDGYSAALISKATHEAALRFLRALPASLPAPDIVPEPDGDIAFEWEYGKWKILSVSVNSKGRVAYAAILGRDKRKRGSELFDDVVPVDILSILWSIRPQ